MLGYLSGELLVLALDFFQLLLEFVYYEVALLLEFGELLGELLELADFGLELRSQVRHRYTL